MGSSCSWWSSENTNVNVTASECAEPYMDGAWRTGSCMEIYLQHVTKHVHALENGEPKLRNACWIFHRHGFLFFRILNRSLYLYLRLRAMSTSGTIPISIRKNEIRWKTQYTALCQKCLISLKVACEVNQVPTYGQLLLFISVALPLALIICRFHWSSDNVSSLWHTTPQTVSSWTHDCERKSYSDGFKMCVLNNYTCIIFSQQIEINTKIESLCHARASTHNTQFINTHTHTKYTQPWQVQQD